jgi:N-methylhydantoinase A
MWRVGSDVGGTFTDVVAWDESSGKLHVGKRPTQPGRPAHTILAALDDIRAGAGEASIDIGFLGHATTVVTNAVIEGDGARTALLTTKGFRDVLEIKRLGRSAEQLYDPLCHVGAPLIPRRDRFEVDERVTWRGEALRIPTDEGLREIVDALRSREITAVAVCFLFSFLRPEHEEMVGSVLQRELPGVSVTLSSEIDRRTGEYERSALTALTASVRPLLEQYVDAFQVQLRDAEVAAPVYFMKSNGGVTTPQLIGKQAALSLLSGPAAGVVASQYVGEALGFPNIISADMGGTSFDVALISEGAAVRSSDKTVHELPLRLPVLDITTIGAGGGSLAFVDSAGALRVGPRSAGSEPGPACYDRGGSEATVTDANVVLGILNPTYLLDGSMKIDASLADRVCERLGAQLELSTAEAAAGIRTVVNSAMVGAIRTITVGVGRDPRDFVMVAYGGAGPLHAVQLADSLGIEWVIIPPHPGCHSAFGLLVTDLVHDYGQSLLAPCQLVDCAKAEAEFRHLEDRAQEDATQAGLPRDHVVLARALGMRYSGQNSSLLVNIESSPFAPAVLDRAVVDFHELHEDTFGFSADGEQVEIVDLRLQSIGTIPRPAERPAAVATSDTTIEPAAHRTVLLEPGVPRELPIYRRAALPSGCVVDGPCIIEQLDSTTFVPRLWKVTVESMGVLVIGRRAWTAPSSEAEARLSGVAAS